MSDCRVCQIQLDKGNSRTGWGRCNEHYHCDDCGTLESLCFYTEGLLCDPCHTKRVQGRMASFKGDTSYASEATCPWCGYEHGDSWELENGIYECGDCGNSYEVTRNMEITFSTTKAI